jgi:hypothetical protein
MSTEALQRSVKHEARLSNISVYFRGRRGGIAWIPEILRFAWNDRLHHAPIAV